MAGRKKGRGGSSRVAPADLQEEVTEEVVTTPVVKKSLEPPLVLDPWTDEQETSLFKGIVKWKPLSIHTRGMIVNLFSAGMHKHFRMVAISQNLRNHGYTTPRDDHTRIPYIWEKLGSLYNLEALDERENLMVEHSLEGRDKDPMVDAYRPFSLPHEYGEMMFAKRLAPEGFISPGSAKLTRSDESEDVEAQPDDVMPIDTDATDPQPESPTSPTPTPPQTPITAATPIAAAEDTPTPKSSTRGTRGTRGTRRSQLQSENSRSLGRRGGRKTSMDKAAIDKALEDKATPEGDKTENIDSGSPVNTSKTRGRRGKRRG